MTPSNGAAAPMHIAVLIWQRHEQFLLSRDIGSRDGNRCIIRLQGLDVDQFPAAELLQLIDQRVVPVPGHLCESKLASAWSSADRS